MIDVILDTNVLVAALLKKGGPNRAALRKVLDPRTPLQICYSSQMVSEYEDVLTRHLIVSRGLSMQAKALLDIVLDEGDEIVPKYLPAIVYPDENDRPFLEAAVYVEGIILTNNIKDYPYLGVSVVGPEELLIWCDSQGF